MDAIDILLGRLPEKPATSYDALAVSEPHWERLADHSRKDAADPLAEAPQTFAGLVVRVNPAVPDGFALMMKGAEAVGLIDFKNNRVTLTRSRG